VGRYDGDTLGLKEGRNDGLTEGANVGMVVGEYELQLEAPTPEYQPLRHGVQVEAPEVEYVFSEHD
jgi:hypothetical protein